MLKRGFLLLPLLSILACQEHISFQSLHSKSPELEEQKSEALPAGFEEKYFTLKKPDKPRLDILIVIDSSESMQVHLKQLGNSLSSLLKFLPEYAWRIGIITSDHGDHKKISQHQGFYEDKWRDHPQAGQGSFGRLMPLEIQGRVSKKTFLDETVQDYSQVFFHSLSHYPDHNCDLPPFCQKYLEQPLRALKSAIERYTFDNTHFFRPHADLVSLIITNEDERMEDSRNATQAQEVIQAFNKYLKPLDKKFFAFGILIDSPSCLREELKKSERAAQAEIVKQLAEKTGGFNSSLCQKNQDHVLEKISKMTKVVSENSLDIGISPKPASLTVEFLEGASIPYKLVGSKLIFEANTQEETRIRVTYQNPELSQ